jgi:hypothetical protein
MKFYSSEYSKQLHIFNFVFVYFQNIDKKPILHLILHTECKVIHLFC